MSIMDLLFSFEGRIGRLSYWLGVLVKFLIIAGLWVSNTAMFSQTGGNPPPIGQLLVFWALGLGLVMWVGLAVQAKRWHDRGKSGWWWLLGLVPMIGTIWVLVELGFLAGTPGGNAYGPPPGPRDAAGEDDFDADRALEHWRTTASRQERAPASPVRAAGVVATASVPTGARGFGRRGLI